MAADQTPDSMPSSQQPARADSAPGPAVWRISLYLRELEGLVHHGHETVSSKQLGKVLNLTDAQVRKDLACFGQFGRPGIGYRVRDLIARLRSILGTDRTWNVLLVGAGHLGSALLNYRGFSKKGFQLVAVFDNDPAKIGTRIGLSPGLEVLPLEKLADTVVAQDVQIGVVAVPAAVAQTMANVLVAAGIKGILNFAPAALNVPDKVALANVDLAVQLEQLAFRISVSQAGANKLT